MYTTYTKKTAMNNVRLSTYRLILYSLPTIPFFFTFLSNCTGPEFYFSSIFTNSKTPKTFKTLKILKFKN